MLTDKTAEGGPPGGHSVPRTLCLRRRRHRSELPLGAVLRQHHGGRLHRSLQNPAGQLAEVLGSKLSFVPLSGGVVGTDYSASHPANHSSMPRHRVQLIREEPPRTLNCGASALPYLLATRSGQVLKVGATFGHAMACPRLPVAGLIGMQGARLLQIVHNLAGDFRRRMRAVDGGNLAGREHDALLQVAHGVSEIVGEQRPVYDY